MERKNRIIKSTVLTAALLLTSIRLTDAQPAQHAKATGVENPAVRHNISELTPTATIHLGGDPDWMAVTDDGVWVAISSLNRVVRLDAATNHPDAQVQVAEPCSGLVADFGSIWIPSCGEHKLIRADARTGTRQAVIDAGPGDAEGGICSGAGSIWIVGLKTSELLRIDPSSNQVVARIHLPPASMNPVFANGSIWISSKTGGMLVRVDAIRNSVAGKTPVGPSPRFLTVGAGSVWVLNQGDGTIARVDPQTAKRTALIRAGIPGPGGEIAFGEGAIWATVFGFPMTKINPGTNEVTAQWTGHGGDSIRVGHGSIWLTDLKGGAVWRFAISKN